ncbi:MAG TPA: Mut7-C RNAse domain-containing protein [Desulfuromonadales bacterium]|nr:Mut7-C RNAse domain-containing protein [Desulfuromonadales bacterium]
MDHSARFQFHGSLAKLAVTSSAEETVDYSFNGHPAVKDAIEALGVPHTEVDVITVNGQSVGLDHSLEGGDVVGVFPFAWRLDCEPLVRLIPSPPEPLSFILDVHLGKLARRLRLLGFDTLYRNDFSDPEIARRATAEERIVLTRDRGLLKRKTVRHGCLLTSGDLQQQLEVLQNRYGVLDRIKPLVRCPVCNGPLREVDKTEIADQLQPKTMRHQHDFRRCVDCGKIYWRGSHAEKILAWLRQIRGRRGL